MADSKIPELKVPDTLGACADLLFNIKEQRRKLEAEAEEWHKQETALTEHIIRVLPKSDSGAMGRHHKVRVVTREVPRVADWALFWEFIRKNKAYEMVQRRVAEGAVRDRWDANKKVPGVEPFTVVSLSLTKV